MEMNHIYDIKSRKQSREASWRYKQQQKKYDYLWMKIKYFTLDRQHGSSIGQNIIMNEFNFEVVQSLKYIGSVINTSNCIEAEIQMRTTQRNKCFYALRHLSILLSRSPKFKLHETMVKPIGMYGSETWSLAN